MLSAAASPFCRPFAPEGAFCKPVEDPFLLLESTLRSMEEILRRSRGLRFGSRLGSDDSGVNLALERAMHL